MKHYLDISLPQSIYSVCMQVEIRQLQQCIRFIQVDWNFFKDAGLKKSNLYINK